MSQVHQHFALNVENLKRIPFEKYDKDFTFIVEGKKYETQRIVADLLSPIVSKYHYIDKTLTEYTIRSPTNKRCEKTQEENEDYFQSFLKLQNFQEQELDENRRKKYSEYFIKLGNISEYLKLQQYCHQNQITTDNVLNQLIELSEIQEYIHDNQEYQKSNVFADFFDNNYFNELIEFSASHFSEMSHEKLKELPFIFIEAILKNKKLVVEDEDQLMEFILEKYEEENEFCGLFECVEFCNVEKETLSKFIDKFNIENINYGIWKSLCKRILYGFQNKYKQKQESEDIIEIKIEQNNEFKGIMNYLSEKTGGNIHDNKTIEITSNSISMPHHPKNLVDYQNYQSIYHSNRDDSDINICFDFKNKEINLSSYSIKSYQNGLYMKSWIIEASNDGKSWTKIDEHINDSSLNRANAISTFHIKKNSEFYKFIRLRQTDKNWGSNNYYIQLRFIEFYGRLKIPQT